ncbi:MAG: DUF302 domain-containing protein [Verrucomicrobiaceae bacterium]|nr:DUF302 domain-containing protein [Verrucomicrobiaceae bacterium]NCF93106.1 DUF302 domain-containing protein [Verrucomicrobiaceae bacterium]
MHLYNLKETMAKRGVEFGHDCQIFEICQPEQAQRVLDLDMSASTALPCRISIYREDGQTVFSTLKPTMLFQGSIHRNCNRWRRKSRRPSSRS